MRGSDNGKVRRRGQGTSRQGTSRQGTSRQGTSRAEPLCAEPLCPNLSLLRKPKVPVNPPPQKTY